MFTGYQYFVYFHTKTSHIVKVQKRATKFIISLKKYSYKDCLMQLNLPTLKYRRLQWDMIEVFKIVKQKYDTTTFSSFILTAEMMSLLAVSTPRLVSK